jgi:hypothetical protein
MSEQPTGHEESTPLHVMTRPQLNPHTCPLSPPAPARATHVRISQTLT